jgi:hypothetical protein
LVPGADQIVVGLPGYDRWVVPLEGLDRIDEQRYAVRVRILTSCCGQDHLSTEGDVGGRNRLEGLHIGANVRNQILQVLIPKFGISECLPPPFSGKSGENAEYDDQELAGDSKEDRRSTHNAAPD